MVNVITKTLTFSLDPKFNGPCTLTLGFAPVTQDVNENMYPVAWKVFELNAQNNTKTILWNNDLAGGHAVVDAQDVVTAPVYIRIPPGYSTELHKDNTASPPLYSFSSIKPFGKPNNKQCRVVNVTSSVESIAAGFVTSNSAQGGREEMEIVLVANAVQDNKSVFIDHVPTLTVWANLNVHYKESEFLDRTMGNIPIVWRADLSKLSGNNTTITISRDLDGNIKGTGGGASYYYDSFEPTQTPNQAIYTANLTFAVPALVDESLRAIVDELSAMSYTTTKTITNGYDTEASLTLTLTQGKSFNQAQQDIISAIKNVGMYGKAFVNGHSGAICVASSNGSEKYLAINPASDKWFGIGGNSTQAIAFDGVADAKAFAAQDGTAESGGRRAGLDVAAAA
ncbi:uncharacterized protein TRAVEDRAFT_53458 [Trametes versicolor FP-101664 SS1]|uniref:uncharacterized protein n=1 Tax=Trametes versicolor (strain FP-101664) TaxID=717944 RepID=UPI0004624A07|nr:uncharacterized protein TRAVEDRAFT_53458 [Trametes versicolor FP-101664 SS1]EIW53041.1 hypothetical protein TRAVEDRAFT_53458 [Trametes versicolor FP-101664 SS1]